MIKVKYLLIGLVIIGQFIPHKAFHIGWIMPHRIALHYAEVGDIQQGLGLPGKASLCKMHYLVLVLKFGH